MENQKTYFCVGNRKDSRRKLLSHGSPVLDIHTAITGMIRAFITFSCYDAHLPRRRLGQDVVPKCQRSAKVQSFLH